MVRVIFCKLLRQQKLPHVDLTGKNAIVTGCNTGLGKGMIFHLAKMNANVYMVCRNLKKAEAARADILEQVPDAKLHIMQLDTSSLDNVRAFCTDWAAEGKTIDILMHNAGAGAAPGDTVFSEEGLEYMYVTNFLSNFLMIYLLEKYFAPDAHITFTSSPGVYLTDFSKDFSTEQVKDKMEKGFNYGTKVKPIDSMIYSNTKLMQLYSAKALTKKYTAEGKNFYVNAFSPGYAASDFFENQRVRDADKKKDPTWWGLGKFNKYGIPSVEGCKTGVYLATSSDKRVKDHAGRLWERMNPWTSWVCYNMI